LIAFWLPIPPGIVAFLQLRKTAARWDRERERGALPEPAAAGAGANRGGRTSLQKVK
jgi:hypothetical protein